MSTGDDGSARAFTRTGVALGQASRAVHIRRTRAGRADGHDVERKFADVTWSRARCRGGQRVVVAGVVDRESLNDAIPPTVDPRVVGPRTVPAPPGLASIAR